MYKAKLSEAVKLSKQQIESAEALCEGLQYSGIAKKSGRSVKSIESDISQIYKKFGLQWSGLNCGRTLVAYLVANKKVIIKNVCVFIFSAFLGSASVFAGYKFFSSQGFIFGTGSAVGYSFNNFMTPKPTPLLVAEGDDDDDNGSCPGPVVAEK